MSESQTESFIELDSSGAEINSDPFSVQVEVSGQRDEQGKNKSETSGIENGVLMVFGVAPWPFFILGVPTAPDWASHSFRATCVGFACFSLLAWTFRTPSLTGLGRVHSIRVAMIWNSVASWIVCRWWPAGQALWAPFMTVEHIFQIVGCKLLLDKGTFWHFLFTLVGSVGGYLDHEYQYLFTNHRHGRRLSDTEQVKAQEEQEVEVGEDYAMKVVILVAALIVGMCAIGYWTPSRCRRPKGALAGGIRGNFDDVQRIAANECGPDEGVLSDAMNIPATSSAEETAVSWAVSDVSSRKSKGGGGDCSGREDSSLFVFSCTEEEGEQSEAGDEEKGRVTTPTSEVGVGSAAQEDSGFRDQASMTKVSWKEDASHFVCSWCTLPAVMPTRKTPNVDGTWELESESSAGSSSWMRCFTISNGFAQTPEGIPLKLRHTQDHRVKLEGKEIYLKNRKLCRAGGDGKVRRWRACGLPGSPNGPPKRCSKIRGGVLNGSWEILPQFITTRDVDVSHLRMAIRKNKVTYGNRKLSLEQDGKGRAWLEGQELFLVSGYLLLASDESKDVVGWRQVYGNLEDEETSDGDDADPADSQHGDRSTGSTTVGYESTQSSSASTYQCASTSELSAARCHAATQTHANFECECRCGLPVGIEKQRPKPRKNRKSRLSLLGRGTPVR